MEETAHAPLPIRHTLIHEKGIFRFSLLSGTLIFLALTGLAIWLLPFSIPIQASVLLHTLLGLAIVIPLTLWQLSHWLATRKVPRSFRKICAYTGFKGDFLAACTCGLRRLEQRVDTHRAGEPVGRTFRRRL